MSIIKLTILKKDIMENNYHDSDNCPITRALARAGHPELKDVGGSIRSKDWPWEDPTLINKSNCSNYEPMLLTLLGMLKYEGFDILSGNISSQPAKDFEVELVYGEDI